MEEEQYDVVVVGAGLRLREMGAGEVRLIWS
jgi:hypothetical protein